MRYELRDTKDEHGRHSFMVVRKREGEPAMRALRIFEDAYDPDYEPRHAAEQAK